MHGGNLAHRYGRVTPAKKAVARDEARNFARNYVAARNFACDPLLRRGRLTKLAFIINLTGITILITYFTATNFPTSRSAGRFIPCMI